MKSEMKFSESGYTSADIQLFHDAVGIEKLLADFPVIRFAAQEKLPAIVDGNAMLYFVLTGALKVSTQTARIDAANEKAEPGNEVLPGECAGAFSVLGGERRKISIVATQLTEVLAIDADGIWKLIDESSGFARKLLMLRSSGIPMPAAQTGDPEIPSTDHSIIDGRSAMQNRAWLDQHLTGMTQEAHETKRPFSILCVSLDNIEHFIESFDFFAAEEALSITGSVIMETLRPTDVAVRYGDNALLVLLPDVDIQSAVIVAQRLSENLKKTVVFADMREPLPHITASIGVACLESKQGEQDLIAASAAALDRAKKMGKASIAT